MVYQPGLDAAANASFFVGWQGKLPAVGDFVSRGLTDEFQNTVHSWTSRGMRGLSLKYPSEWRHAYLLTPVWHFVINAGGWDSHAIQGCLAPSLDKVGRLSPLLVVRSFDERKLDEVLPPASDWSYRVDERVREAIAQRLGMDDVLKDLDSPFSSAIFQDQGHSAGNILKVLGISEDASVNTPKKRWFSWPDLNQLFSDRTDRSFWWAEPSPKQPPRQIIHSGKPDEELFILLMGGALFDSRY